jgi:hypothetical protein
LPGQKGVRQLEKARGRFGLFPNRPNHMLLELIGRIGFLCKGEVAENGFHLRL